MKSIILWATMSSAAISMYAAPLAAEEAKIKETPNADQTQAPLPELLPEETENLKPSAEQQKSLSEALLKIGLCNVEYYGKDFCAKLSDKAETAPPSTPPVATALQEEVSSDSEPPKAEASASQP